MSESRRAFLQKVFVAASAAFAGDLFPWPHVLASTRRRGSAPLSGYPLRFPPTFSGTTLLASISNQQLWPGYQTRIWSLNEAFPGPTIRLQRGDALSLQLLNQLSEALILHWHGVLSPADMDGHPSYAVGAGGSYEYGFPIVQRAATCFYHSHTHRLTGKQVYLGLAGFFIVEDEVEQQLGLPEGEFDVPLAIQDKRVDAARQLVYAPSMMDKMSGYLGSTPLVNGTPEAFLQVRRTLYRLRVLNASNARVYRIAFSDLRPFHVIATDGGLLEGPVEATSLYLAPGERVELLVQFGAYPIGRSVWLKSLAFSAGGGQGTEMNLIRFDVAGDSSIQPSVPSRLDTLARLDPATAVRTRVFDLQMNMMRPAINGRTFVMSRIDETVYRRETEIWVFRNLSNVMHPMHIHGVHFQVLDRNGNTNLPPNDLGWKDTVLVFPNEVLRVILRFEAYRGLFLLHCHNLEHEDAGMMLNIDVTSNPTDRLGDDRSRFLHASPNPAAGETVLRFSPDTPSRELRILDARGRLRATYPVEPGAAAVAIRTDELPSGTYWCELGHLAVKLLVLD